jgi:hypothetical protein
MAHREEVLDLREQVVREAVGMGELEPDEVVHASVSAVSRVSGGTLHPSRSAADDVREVQQLDAAAWIGPVPCFPRCP